MDGSGVRAILWIDLETTGLDPENDHVMEIGWFLTPAKFWEVTELQAKRQVERVFCSSNTGAALSRLSDEVLEMHVRSGLLEEWSTAARTGFGEAMIEIFCQASKFAGVAFNPTWSSPLSGWLALGGSNCDFEESFIRRLNLMVLVESLSHRKYDASRLRQVFGAVRPDFRWTGSPDVPHRAVPDVLDHFNEMCHYARLIDRMEVPPAHLE